MDRIAEARRQFEELVAQNQSLKDLPMDDRRDKMSKDFDALLGYVLENWREMPTHDQVREFIKFDPGSCSIFEDLPAEIIPIAVAKAVINWHRIPIHVPLMGNFGEFAKRYRNAILG